MDSQLRVYKSTAILDPIFAIRAHKVSHFINANIPEDLKAKQMPQIVSNSDAPNAQSLPV